MDVSLVGNILKVSIEQYSEGTSIIIKIFLAKTRRREDAKKNTDMIIISLHLCVFARKIIFIFSGAHGRIFSDSPVFPWSAPDRFEIISILICKI